MPRAPAARLHKGPGLRRRCRCPPGFPLLYCLVDAAGIYEHTRRDKTPDLSEILYNPTRESMQASSCAMRPCLNSVWRRRAQSPPALPDEASRKNRPIIANRPFANPTACIFCFWAGFTEIETFEGCNPKNARCAMPPCLRSAWRW